MEIEQIKFKTIDSTQLWLKENLSSYAHKNILVSTEQQTAGLGRMGNTWNQHGSSLAFSFSLSPNEVLTLTPLEVGAQLIHFFKAKNINLGLKWPNDILKLEENGPTKVAGILSQQIGDISLIGIGINCGHASVNNDYKFPAGTLGTLLKEEDFHGIPLEFYQYILKNRMTKEQIIKAWNESCIHLNQKVRVIDNQTETAGEFLGIGSFGEALIDEIKVYTGSLFIEN